MQSKSVRTSRDVANYGRIGLNLLPYAPDQHGGAEIYIQNLIRHLALNNAPNRYVLFVSPRGRGAYLPDDERFSEVVLPRWSAAGRVARIVAEQLILPFYVRRAKIQVLFSNYVAPLLAPVPQVVNIHDMLYKRLPELIEPAKRFYWAAAIPLSLWRSSKVLTVSHASAADIRHYFPQASSKIMVTVEGVHHLLEANSNVDPTVARHELGLHHAYIMCAATFAKHKNLHTLIEAFATVSQHNSEIRLVLTGGANSPDAQRERKALVTQVNSLGLAHRVIFTGYVRNELLAALYKGAVMYVIPSLYEGFGLSIIEAQYFGAPVICSNTPALVEVAGKGAVVVQATMPAEYSDAILKLIGNEEFRQELALAGRKNVTRFSWQQAAKDFLSAVNPFLNLDPHSRRGITSRRYTG